MRLSEALSEGNIIQAIMEHHGEAWYFRGELVEFVPARRIISLEKVKEFYGKPKPTEGDKKYLVSLMNRGISERLAKEQVQRRIEKRYENWRCSPNDRWLANRWESFDKATGVWIPAEAGRKSVLPDTPMASLQVRLALWDGEKFVAI